MRAAGLFLWSGLLLLGACGEADTDSLDGGGPPGPNDAGDAATDLGLIGDPDVGPDAGPDAGPDGGSSVDATPPDVGPTDSGPSACDLDPSCVGCCALGDHCTFSINCPVGAICNLPSENYYDPSRPAETCLQVACTRNEDCASGKVCDPSGICLPPVCGDDQECAAGQRCLGGSCQVEPTFDDCRVVPRAVALAPGSTVPVEVIGYVQGQAVGQVGPSITVSAPAGVANVQGGRVQANASAGSFLAQASIGNLACTGQVELHNYGPRAPGATRVVVVEERYGAPIVGADVAIDFGTGRVEGTTDAQGAFAVSEASLVEAVSVTAEGHASVSVLEPGGNDLVIVLPPFHPTRAGGFWGGVETSALRSLDLRMGWAGAAFPVRLHDFGYDGLLTAGVPTEVNAPELGLSGEVIDLPESQLLSLGNRSLTEADTRCFGPGRPGELRCFLSQAEGPFGAMWSHISHLRLAEVTGVVNELGLFGILLPSGGRLGHALVPYLEHPAQLPLVSPGPGPDCSDPAQAEACAPDYANFDPLTLQLADVPRHNTVVDLPWLSNTCDREVVVLAVVELPGRGLVPLGYTSARQDPNNACALRVPLAPFGTNLGPTQVPISIAARHQGAEGHPIHLVVIALPPTNGGVPDGTTQMVVVHDVPMDPQLSATTEPMPLPEVVVERGPQRYTLDPSVTADLLVLELEGQGQRRYVYSPATTGVRFDVPVLAGALELPDAAAVRISAVDLGASYSTLFELGSGRTAESLEGVLDGATTVPCEVGAARCQLQ